MTASKLQKTIGKGLLKWIDLEQFFKGHWLFGNMQVDEAGHFLWLVEFQHYKG